MRYDSVILSDTGEWLPPEPDFPNLTALMTGASMDVLKIQRARQVVNQMGEDMPLLPPAMVDAVNNTLPQEYWPFPRTAYPPRPRQRYLMDTLFSG